MSDRIKSMAYELAKEAGFTPFDAHSEIVQNLVMLTYKESVKQLVIDNLSDPEYEAAMDEHYERKWGYRFDVW